MVRKLLLLTLVLSMSMCSVSTAIIQDNFDGTTIDLTKWQLINGPAVSINQSGGNVFFNRPVTQLNYLVTRKQYDPAVTPLTITGSAELGGDPDMDIWTRANIIANTAGGWAHILDSGIRINFWADAVDSDLRMSEKTAGVFPLDYSISDGASITGDDSVIDWSFQITDDGTTITATFWQTSDPNNTLTTTGTSATHFDTNYIAFTVVNGYLKNVTIIPQGLELAGPPTPADKEPNVPLDVILGWKPGEYAARHNVYFGTNVADVSTATTTNHPNVEVSINQDANTYDPIGLLNLSQTYYWRIDEVNDAHPDKLWGGTVWSFTTELVAYPIDVGNIKATASSQSSGMGPEKTIDRSGLIANDQHSTSATDMWLSEKGGAQPTYIQYEFDKVYKLHEMWVWNSNQQLERLLLGYGLKNVTIQYSTDGLNWTQLSGVPAFAQGTGQPNYTHSTTVSFSDVAAKYVKITANSNYGSLKQYGLSEVRFFQIPVHAREPDPNDGQKGVALDAVLRWRSGREAATHKLYISSSKSAVKNETVASKDIPYSGSYANSDPLSLDLGKTYYWKIDEVNNTTTWHGDIWSFSTTEYLTMEDFEEYNNDSPDRVFQTWLDGVGYSKDKYFPVTYCGNDTGAAVGHDIWSLDSPYYEGNIMETTIFHDGQQSMPFNYNNTGTTTDSCSGTNPLYYSKTERTFSTPQNWTKVGIKALALYFYGDPNNTQEPMWVKLTDQSNRSGKVTYGTSAGEDVGDMTEQSWHEWNIALAGFGVDLTKITKLAIGIGNEAGTTPAGSGTVYFDDIRLYSPRCLPTLLMRPAGDVTGDCMVDYSDLYIMAEQWLDTAVSALIADLNADKKVDLRDFAKLAQDWLEDARWPQQ